MLVTILRHKDNSFFPIATNLCREIRIFVGSNEIEHFKYTHIMKFLTDEKLLIVGAAGMIGSNMVQTAAMLGLTPNICLYDIFEPGLKGVLAEMDHCAFEGVNLTATIDPAVALKDAKYIISSGGAPRKEA